MPRPLSKIAPEWWDYTTLDSEILTDAAKLTVKDIEQLSRPGFKVVMYDDLSEFWLAEALEYVNGFRLATADNPVGVCGPIGPTEQLPLVAAMINGLGIDVKNAHFWGMDEWCIDGKAVPPAHPLSFARTDREMCFDRIRPELAMPLDHLHFPSEHPEAYMKSWDEIRCVVMQGGQGETKHWAFNDPVRRQGAYKDNPPTPEQYRQFHTREVELHPLTLVQNARTSGAGNIPLVPGHAFSVGPVETWKADKVSIWHPGWHDTPFGIRLSALMISKRVPDGAVPMSLLADHPDVQFNYYRPGIKPCDTEMH